MLLINVNPNARICGCVGMTTGYLAFMSNEHINKYTIMMVELNDTNAKTKRLHGIEK